MILLSKFDSGKNTRGRLKVHVDKKLDVNNVQLQTTYSMYTGGSLGSALILDCKCSAIVSAEAWPMNSGAPIPRYHTARVPESNMYVHLLCLGGSVRLSSNITTNGPLSLTLLSNILVKYGACPNFVIYVHLVSATENFAAILLSGNILRNNSPLPVTEEWDWCELQPPEPTVFR